jgi:hypothetical protein
VALYGRGIIRVSRSRPYLCGFYNLMLVAVAGLDLTAEPPNRATTELSPEAKYENRGVAQLGSAPDWGSGGRGFKSPLPDQNPNAIPA